MYKIGKNRKGEFVNELAEAIAEGEFLELLQECADKLHDGDLAEAVRVYRKNLSSQLTNMKKAETPQVDFQRYEILEAYTKQFVSTVSSNVSPVFKDKPKWQATKEEILTLTGNYEELRKLYNLMADYKSKHKDQIEKLTTLDEYVERINLVRELRNEAEKASASKASEDILAKLKANKKLTKEETAELVKLLTK